MTAETLSAIRDAKLMLEIESTSKERSTATTMLDAADHIGILIAEVERNTCACGHQFADHDLSTGAIVQCLICKDDEGRTAPTVTHWMPLPNPPLSASERAANTRAALDDMMAAAGPLTEPPA